MTRTSLRCRFGLIALMILLQSCTSATAPEPSNDATSGATPRLEFLYFDGCPNSPVLEQHLAAALERSGWHSDYRRIDLTQLADNDLRLRFGAPTILLDGADLFGTKPTHAPALSCRHYPDGLPNVDAIVTQLGTDAARDTNL